MPPIQLSHTIFPIELGNYLPVDANVGHRHTIFLPVMVALTTPEIMQSFSSNMNSKTLHESIIGMYDPYLSCRDTDSSSATAATDENGLLNPMNSPIFRELLSFPDTDPLFVSPSDQGPSDKIASCLSVVFPNVPERAKQNNILLTKKEIPWLN